MTFVEAYAQGRVDQRAGVSVNPFEVFGAGRRDSVLARMWRLGWEREQRSTL